MGVATDYIRDEYELYSRIYNLEKYYGVYEKVPEEFFRHVSGKEYFVVVAPFTLDNKYYAIPNATCRMAFYGTTDKDDAPVRFEDLLMSCASELLANGNYLGDLSESSDDDFSVEVDDQCAYRLPADAVDPKIDSTLIETVRRVVNKNMQQDMAGDIIPLAMFTNKFICETGKVHYHRGIGFSCRLRMSGDAFTSINSKRGRRLSGILINNTQDNLQYYPHNWDYLLMMTAFARTATTPIDDYEGEINSSRSLRARYFLHTHLFKHILKLIKSTKKELDQIIKSELDLIIKRKKKVCFLNISAGDDRSSIKMAEDIYPNGIVVANDVSWDSLARLKTTNKHLVENIYYTNHSASEPVYKTNAVDISICKNTFHHTRDHAELVALIGNMLSATSETAIFIDIDRPCYSFSIPCLVNAYYRKFLDDQGDNFLTEKQFRVLFSSGEVQTLITTHGFCAEVFSLKSKFGNSMVAVLRKAPTLPLDSSTKLESQKSLFE